MLTLEAKNRKEIGKKVKNLRKEGILPGVLYGPKVENTVLEINLKEFDRVYREAGENSLITLNLGSEKFLVLINAVEKDPILQKAIHVDFYQPKLDEEITASVPLVFEGEALAIKNLGGTLVKNIHEIEVKALPQNLPHEIIVNIEKLETFEDSILIKDLVISNEVKISKEPEEIIALVAPLERVEEELEKPVEEKVEDVGRVKEKKEEEPEEEK